MKQNLMRKVLVDDNVHENMQTLPTVSKLQAGPHDMVFVLI